MSVPVSIERRRQIGRWLDRWVLRLAVVVGLVVVVTMFWVGVSVSASNSTSSRLSSNADALSCRSLASAKVTEARTMVEDTDRRYNLVYGEAVEHATRDDNPGRLAELLAELPELRQKVLDQSAAAVTASDAYSAAVTLSYNDPHAFLAACTRGEPPFNR